MVRLLTLIGLMCLINTAVVAQDLEIGAFYGQRFGGHDRHGDLRW